MVSYVLFDLLEFGKFNGFRHYLKEVSLLDVKLEFLTLKFTYLKKRNYL